MKKLSLVLFLSIMLLCLFSMSACKKQESETSIGIPARLELTVSPNPIYCGYNGFDFVFRVKEINGTGASINSCRWNPDPGTISITIQDMFCEMCGEQIYVGPFSDVMNNFHIGNGLYWNQITQTGLDVIVTIYYEDDLGNKNLTTTTTFKMFPFQD